MRRYRWVGALGTAAVVAIWANTLDAALLTWGVDRLLFWRTAATALLSGLVWHFAVMFLDYKE